MIQPTTLADTEKSIHIIGFLEIHVYHTTSETIFFLPWTLLLEVGSIHPCYLVFLLLVAAIDQEAIPALPVAGLPISPGSVQPQALLGTLPLTYEQSA